MAFGNHDYTLIYRDAVAAFAARGVAALAGSMRRRGGLDIQGQREIEQLLQALETTALESPRAGAVADAGEIRATYLAVE